ncbi:uncharacterized protein LOC134277245 [Saccostrea cucullata]|uniref:uncharacterized protein LOC134277245 n=1 Tax=Saccostrea cuccullata TaxID=36930 RepID=UPI002ED5443E
MTVHVFSLLASITPCLLLLNKNVIALPLTCPVSISTLRHVTLCPQSEMEWNERAKEKGCEILARHQNCTSADAFSYHCILNADATRLVEVCAPKWFMTGYCARFSIKEKRIINDPGLDCTKFVSPCPPRYNSTEAYKYQKCYAEVERTTNGNEHASSAFFSSPIFWILIVLSCVLLIALITIIFIRGRKKEAKKQNVEDTEKNNQKNEESDKNEKNRPSETEPNLEDHINDDDGITTERPDNQSNEDEELMKFETMTGKTGECSVKGVTNIVMLREKLSKELQFPKEIILVVVKEDGIIYNDDTKFEALRRHQSKIQLVIGKKDRIVHDPELDVISKKPLLNRNCKMSCGHFTAPETAFEYTKDKLTEGESAVLCPTCDNKWEMSELVQKCDMSRDEQIFLEHLISLNLITKMRYKT